MKTRDIPAVSVESTTDGGVASLIEISLNWISTVSNTRLFANKITIQFTVFTFQSVLSTFGFVGGLAEGKWSPEPEGDCGRQRNLDQDPDEV